MFKMHFSNKMATHFSRVALFSFSMIFLAACDSSDLGVNPDAEMNTEFVDDLTASFSLSDDTSDKLDDHARDKPEPGFLWYAAAEIYNSGDQDKIDRILANGRTGVLFVYGRGFGGHGQKTDGRLLHSVLTDAQKEDAKAIRESYSDDIQALRESHDNGDITRQELRTEIGAIKDQIFAEVYALLSADQIAELDQLIADLEAEREARKAASQAAMIDALELDGSQATTVLDLIEDLQTDIDALMEQVEDGSITREEFHDLAMAVNDALFESLESTLSEAQFTIVQIHNALKNRRFRRGFERGHQGRG